MFILAPVSFDLAKSIYPDINVFNQPWEMMLLFVY